MEGGAVGWTGGSEVTSEAGTLGAGGSDSSRDGSAEGCSVGSTEEAGGEETVISSVGLQPVILPKTSARTRKAQTMRGNAKNPGKIINCFFIRNSSTMLRLTMRYFQW